VARCSGRKHETIWAGMAELPAGVVGRGFRNVNQITVVGPEINLSSRVTPAD
jgi:hypothetical protein